MESLHDFVDTAKGLARNPLGIIALFIALIYGFASLVLGFSENLVADERVPIVWFLVFFPVIVLAVFTWLVSQHHTKLYAPSDYQEDDAFIRASQSSLEAAVSLGAANAKWAAQNSNKEVSREEFEKFTRTTAETIVKASHHGLMGGRGKRVLWVDDRPKNNVFERQSLEALGFQFTLALSTEEALEALSCTEFDAIISDMGRPPDQRAGYTLLKSLRSEGDQTPFLIYAGSRSPEHIKEAKKRGAQGTTNMPDQLFEMVLTLLGMK